MIAMARPAPPRARTSSMSNKSTRTKSPGATRFARVTLLALRIDDERSLRRVALYPRLKACLVRDAYRFRVQTEGRPVDWNRAVFLNLSFWNTADSDDVVVNGRLPADVVAHVAWHHLARRALGPAGKTVDGMLLGESIASAFDVYLIGHLLGSAPGSPYVESQVSAMAEVAGLSAATFRQLLERLALDPSRAFSQLRGLLFDVATSLARARGVDDAAERLDAHEKHPLFPLLHHYNLSNWLLHGRAYGPPIGAKIDARIARVDAQLRAAEHELDWLDRHWLRPCES